MNDFVGANVSTNYGDSGKCTASEIPDTRTAEERYANPRPGDKYYLDPVASSTEQILAATFALGLIGLAASAFALTRKLKGPRP